MGSGKIQVQLVVIGQENPEGCQVLDSFEIMVKVAPSVRPGQFIVYHAWENYQFRGQKGFQNLIPTPLNPVELAGGQFHLRPMAICLQPSHTDRDTRVEVSRLA